MRRRAGAVFRLESEELAEIDDQILTRAGVLTSEPLLALRQQFGGAPDVGGLFVDEPVEAAAGRVGAGAVVERTDRRQHIVKDRVHGAVLRGRQS